MTKTQNALLLPLALLALGATACASTGPRGGERGERVAQIRAVETSRTILDAHLPQPVAVEARLALGAGSGASGLTQAEHAQIAAFATEFIRLGRGNVVISAPADAANSAAAALLAQDAQRALFAAGVDFARMSGGAYQASGQSGAPVIVSFARHEVAPVTCTPWSQIDPRKTASNAATERFGCAQSANLAAMLADPGDLLGDRGEAPKDAERIQVGVDKLRKGEIEQVSGSVGGGGGQ
jgi:pilus assembly protein CpaD